MLDSVKLDNCDQSRGEVDILLVTLISVPKVTLHRYDPTGTRHLERRHELGVADNDGVI